jgi:hypothetical protein
VSNLSPWEESLWLLRHPQFKERPATIREFLGPGYLNIIQKIRPGIISALERIFGDDVSGSRISLVERAMITGAIGIGKTTFASIALPYMVHWVLCLKDPQDYYGLLPGSRIAFMMMSTSEEQARQVIFGDVKARIDGSEWFRNQAPYDPKFTKSIRFPNDVWILPGDSAETTFEGYNILAGILDEADSHKLTKERDYAELGYNTIEGRIQSRFVDNTDPGREGHKGLLIVIGQMKKANGFAHTKYNEMLDDPHAVVVRMTIWESFGWDKYTNPDGTRNSFWFDIRRIEILPDHVGRDFKDKEQVLEIPRAFVHQFKTHPYKALKDLAGIPPNSEDPFITLQYTIDDAEYRWLENNGPDVPVDDNCTHPQIAAWVGTENHTDSRKRVGHLDIAYSPEGDSAGLAFGHVRELVETEDGEIRPYIVIDLMIRVRAPMGGEIMLGDLRSYVYLLKSRGMRIDKITMDGFQSVDTRQQFVKRRIRVADLSMDKTKLGYEDLREALYEGRIEFPPYYTYLFPGSTERVNILPRELLGLTDVGPKIDHAKGGSKDVADCVAGVVCTLMGDNTYRKGLSSQGTHSLTDESKPGKTAQEAMDELFAQFDRKSGPTGGQFGDVISPLAGQMPTSGAGAPKIIVPDRLRTQRER